MTAGTLATKSRSIIGQRVDYTTYQLATEAIFKSVNAGQGGYVCISTVHMIMEGYDDPDFREIVNRADLITPDGMPLVWGLWLQGVHEAKRVYGPALTPYSCAAAMKERIPVGFYGGMDDILEKMQDVLLKDNPDLKIAYAYSPPFRPLTDEEDEKIVSDIINSGAKILYVGIGCPKQERWMAAHKDRLPAVMMLGVGAAFDFIAGEKSQAPGWIQKAGLEWLFRLLTEPRRLWYRYLYYNPRFMFLFGLQLLGLRKY